MNNCLHGFCFRKVKIRVFQPKTKNEISVMRQWLDYNVDNFYIDTHFMWLGFVRPRNCNGTGRYDHWVGEWSQDCQTVTMDMGIFSKGQPQDSEEWCSLSTKDNGVHDYPCTFDQGAYAVCEVDLTA